MRYVQVKNKHEQVLNSNSDEVGKLHNRGWGWGYSIVLPIQMQTLLYLSTNNVIVKRILNISIILNCFFFKIIFSKLYANYIANKSDVLCF